MISHLKDQTQHLTPEVEAGKNAATICILLPRDLEDGLLVLLFEYVIVHLSSHRLQQSRCRPLVHAVIYDYRLGPLNHDKASSVVVVNVNRQEDVVVTFSIHQLAELDNRFSGDNLFIITEEMMHE